MGFNNRDRDIGEAQAIHARVLENAPIVCPPPMRTKEQKRLKKKIQEKNRTSRLQVLARPTASSRAKAWRNSPEPMRQPLEVLYPDHQPKAFGSNSGRSSKKIKQPKNRTPSKEPSDAMKPVVCNARSSPESDARSLPESPYVDALAECDSDVYFFEPRDLNPLLVDGGDFIFDAFSEDDMSSPVSCSSAFSACVNLESCTKQDSKWSKIFGLTHGVACAFSFAAGLSLGMAIGACSFFQCQQTS